MQSSHIKQPFADLMDDVKLEIWKKHAYGNMVDKLTHEFDGDRQRALGLLDDIYQMGGVVAGSTMIEAWLGSGDSGCFNYPSSDIDIWIDIDTAHVTSTLDDDLDKMKKSGMTTIDIAKKLQIWPFIIGSSAFNVIRERRNYLEAESCHVFHPLIGAMGKWASDRGYLIERMLSQIKDPRFDLQTEEGIKQCFSAHLIHVPHLADMVPEMNSIERERMPQLDNCVLMQEHTHESDHLASMDSDEKRTKCNCFLESVNVPTIDKSRLGVALSISFVVRTASDGIREDDENASCFRIQLNFVNFNCSLLRTEHPAIVSLKPGPTRVREWIRYAAFDFAPLGWLSYSAAQNDSHTIDIHGSLYNQTSIQTATMLWKKVLFINPHLIRSEELRTWYKSNRKFDEMHFGLLQKVEEEELCDTCLLRRFYLKNCGRFYFETTCATVAFARMFKYSKRGFTFFELASKKERYKLPALMNPTWKMICMSSDELLKDLIREKSTVSLKWMRELTLAMREIDSDKPVLCDDPTVQSENMIYDEFRDALNGAVLCNLFSYDCFEYELSMNSYDADMKMIIEQEKKRFAVFSDSGIEIAQVRIIRHRTEQVVYCRFRAFPNVILRIQGHSDNPLCSRNDSVCGLSKRALFQDVSYGSFVAFLLECCLNEDAKIKKTEQLVEKQFAFQLRLRRLFNTGLLDRFGMNAVDLKKLVELQLFAMLPFVKE